MLKTILFILFSNFSIRKHKYYHDRSSCQNWIALSRTLFEWLGYIAIKTCSYWHHHSSQLKRKILRTSPFDFFPESNWEISGLTTDKRLRNKSIFQTRVIFNYISPFKYTMHSSTCSRIWQQKVTSHTRTLSKIFIIANRSSVIYHSIWDHVRNQ
jgi:hypothetical protein